MNDFNKDTVYILDSYGLIYRCYFAFISRPLTNSKGENVSALFGFFKNLHSIFQHYKPAYIAAAMDSKTPTFRHTMYSEYKANRPKTPEDLHAQIPWIYDVLSAAGIPTLQCDGYEADDIIATVASQCRKAGKTCRILSGDKDLMQLVTDTTQILKPDHADVWKVIGPEGVKAEWGVAPEQMLDLLSLYGDSADNVPGVKGCGVKTACKLLEQYGTLEGVYEHADELKGAIGQKIRDGKDNAFFSKKLIALCDSVPCPEIDVNNFKPLDFNFENAAKVLEQFELPSVAKLYAQLSKNAAGNSAVSEPSRTKANKKEETEKPEEDIDGLKKKLIPLHRANGTYTVISTRQELDTFTSKIRSEKSPVAVSVEVKQNSDYTSELYGISLSNKTAGGVYIPFVKNGGLFSLPSVYIKDAVSAVESILSDENATVIFHDMKFIYKVLRHNGMKNIGEFSACAKCIDTMIAAWILEPERDGADPYSLASLAEKKLAVLKTACDEITAKDENFTDADISAACVFAAEKSDITLRLWNELEKSVKRFYKEKLFYEIEMPLVPVLAEMELEGIHLDTKLLETYDAELSRHMKNAEDEIFSAVGHSFNIASTKQLQEILFTELGLRPTKKNKTGYSTDTSVLEELALYHPVPKKILEYRELAKLQSTYVQALPKLCDKNSLIHTTFVQTGTATGRLSCKDPNLQNIPVRNEQGRKIRSAFTSRPGSVFISADYSQIELVVMAHLSKDPEMCKAFEEGTDVHRRTASLIYKVAPKDVTPEMRRLAKTINFGVIYGMSSFRLSNELGISRTQAQEFISNYFANYSAVQKFISDTIQEAREKMRVNTICGRSRYIPAINSANKTEAAAAERIAVNTPIQGSAADIVKKAMLRVNTALKKSGTGAKLLLQVHDELIFECPDDKETIDRTISIIKDCMENAEKLSVPLRVSVEYGKNWGDFH